MNRRTVLKLLAAGLVPPGLSGCTLSSGGGLERIPAEEVPYGLLEATPSTSDGERAASAAPGRPRVFFLNDETLVGVPLVPADRDTRAVLEQVIGSLQTGPDEAAQARGLTTALPPSLTLTVLDVIEGVATIDIGGESNGVSTQQNTFAVGQVVLTATSVSGVSGVMLARNGDPIQAPVEDGALTWRPLVASDFAALRRPRVP
ncbi:GerMN domain-containing protein [Motilibacter aurantiacus]|uniref:GerMN domain-containing protein n=1 Tax=Motilibacter aurantiacus TaxID=2714955 RepID=UPI001409D114|nr:GerMN domain-containing protein [Motilibacter aurantiacus]